MNFFIAWNLIRNHIDLYYSNPRLEEAVKYMNEISVKPKHADVLREREDFFHEDND